MIKFFIKEKQLNENKLFQNNKQNKISNNKIFYIKRKTINNSLNTFLCLNLLKSSY